MLAHHFSHGDDPAKAVAYLLKAAEKATMRASGHEALSLYRKALEQCGPDDLGTRGSVLLKMAFLAFFVVQAGNADDSFRLAQEALAIYERLGDRPNQIAAHTHIQTMYLYGYRDGAESRALDNMLAIATLSENDPDSMQKGLLYQRIGHVYLHRGEPIKTLEWARRAVSLFERLNVTMGTSLGTALTYTGRVAEGLAYQEGNWDPVMNAGNVLVIAIFAHDLMQSLVLLRDVPSALKVGETALPRVMGASEPMEAMIRRPLALAYVLAGEPRRAEEMAEIVAAMERKTYQGCTYEDALAVGLHYRRQGQLGRARRHLEVAIAEHAVRLNIGAVAGCWLGLACVHLEDGERPAARAAIEKALEIARNGGNLLFECWVLPVSAEMYLAERDRERAAQAIDRGFQLLAPGEDWRGLPAPLHLARAMLAAADRRWTNAEHDFEAAVELNRRFRLPYDEATTLAAWGRMDVVRGSGGHRERSRERFASALAIFERVQAVAEAQAVRAELEALRA